MVLIHEKISALLEQRRLKKRDLARALGVSPQTATDICKGRSAITLPHLRNLVAFFDLRADYWLDDVKLLPDFADEAGARSSRAAWDAFTTTGLHQVDDPAQLLMRLRSFVAAHRREFLEAFPDLTAAEKRVLGLVEPSQGVVGRMAEA